MKFLMYQSQSRLYRSRVVVNAPQKLHEMDKSTVIGKTILGAQENG